jgi:OmpA-OmpF porin, OOP family
MKKLAPSLLVFLSAISIADTALAAQQRACCRPQPRWYAAISGSAVFLDDVDITHTSTGFPNPDGQTFKTGFGLSGAVGYRIYPNIRGEIEATFRRNEADTDTATIVTGTGSADQESYALMLNGYYDWHNSSRYTPYIGAGIGIANVSNPRFYNSGGSDTDTFEAWTMAYQFMAGLSYEINTGFRPIEIMVGYRYFTGEDAETDLPPAPGDHSLPNDSHNIELGGRIFF